MFESNKIHVHMLLFYNAITYVATATSKVLMNKNKKIKQNIKYKIIE